MADILEVPLDIAEEVLDNVEDITEIMPEEPVILEEVKPVMKPKAKGRPKGAVNKGPSKPRAQRTKIQEAPLEEEIAYVIRAFLSKEESQTADGSEL